MSPAATIALIILGTVVGIVAAIYLIVPLIKGIVWAVAGLFKAIGAVIMHVFRFVSGMIGDVVRSFGAVLTALLFTPLVLGNVVIGRWSAAAHYGRALKDEFGTLGHCLYRVVIGHPARFFLLGGLLEGVERRIPEAMAQAPGADRPSSRTGQFDGYTIVGSLPGGGSGGRLYVAEPDARKRAAFAKAGHLIEQVVIKSFSLGEGSTLPQIIRESRALEAAKRLGLILDHELTESRFFYAMAFVPGDSLSVVTKRLHTEAGSDGLGQKQLHAALGMISDLLGELDRYHKGGLWHKDVKPDNIIINDGRAHLVDLGLITPLRSAMTLTTHGTEYFRDPEMVRMALRGAKVNEVDGVKFDVYGVGAVLYSVIENNFPAHGGLSQFSRRCPEALRWVVRRAMTDLGNRYASASEMLADVRTIVSAPDAFALQPIDLPSVKGAPAVAAALAAAESPPSHGVWPVRPPAPIPPSAPVEPRYEPAVARAASPVPPPADGVRRFELGSEGGPGPFVKVEVGLGKSGRSGARVRPVLQVTDWYRGSYVRSGDSPEPSPTPEPGPGRAHAAHRGGKRGTASEQLERARQRVERAQKRVHGRLIGHRAPRFNTNPNSGVAAAFFIFLALCVAFPMALVVKSNLKPSSAPQSIITRGADGKTIRISLGGGDALSFSVPSPEIDFDKEDGIEKINKFGERVSAAFEKMRDVRTKSSEPQSKDDSSAATIAESASAPVPMEPVSNPVGTVLFLNMLPFDVAQRESDALDAIVRALNKGRFNVRGLGHDESETDLLAAGKNVVGLNDPRNEDAVARVQQWLESQHGVDAVLWIGLGASPEEVERQLVIRNGFPRQPLLRALSSG